MTIIPGTSPARAAARLGPTAGRGPVIAIIGGPEVFALFLDRYDVFHLSRVPGVRLPGGRPVFPEVPARTPEEVLAAHGLVPDPRQVLDPQKGLTLVNWRRSLG